MSMFHKLKYSRINRNPTPKINNLHFLSILKSCLYSTWFMFNKFVFKLVVACSFQVVCVIKNMLRREPFEFKWPEVHFLTENKQVWPNCHIINYLVFTNLAKSSCTKEYWPLVIFAWTSLCLVHTATNLGQYFLVRSSC